MFSFVRVNDKVVFYDLYNRIENYKSYPLDHIDATYHQGKVHNAYCADNKNFLDFAVYLLKLLYCFLFLELNLKMKSN